MKPDSKISPAAEPEPKDATRFADAESQALLKDLAEQRDLNLRLAADFENFRRRSRQEAETQAAAQKDAFILELLPVTDNLERALASGVSRDTAQFQQGVAMTLQQLQHLLRQHGVESDEVVGQPFDPHQHEAVGRGHDPDQPDNAVLTVIQRGYRRGKKIVRPAKVTVNDLTAS